jgi:RNA polymerase sigma factor (sigma-70 family)
MSSELVTKAQQGDKAAFEELMHLYAPVVVAAVLARVRFDVTEDLVQETFTRAYEKLRGVERPAEFGNWVYGIAVNVAREHRRKNREIPASNALPEPEAPVPPLVDREGLKHCLDRLPESLRELFFLRHIQGLSYEQAAQLKQMNSSWVGERLWKARQLLKRCLQKSGMLGLESGRL